VVSSATGRGASNRLTASSIGGTAVRLLAKAAWRPVLPPESDLLPVGPLENLGSTF